MLAYNHLILFIVCGHARNKPVSIGRILPFQLFCPAFIFVDVFNNFVPIPFLVNAFNLWGKGLGKGRNISEPLRDRLTVNAKYRGDFSDSDNIAIVHFHILRKKEAAPKYDGGGDRFFLTKQIKAWMPCSM